MASKRLITSGEFEVPRTLPDILSGLIQSLDERLAKFSELRPHHTREELRNEFRTLTEVYLWELMSQLNDPSEKASLLHEFFEFWLDLCSAPLLQGSLREKIPQSRSVATLRVQ